MSTALTSGLASALFPYGNCDESRMGIAMRSEVDMPKYPELRLHSAGEWRKAEGQPVINPADESVLGTVPHATQADLDDALAAAEQGFGVWSRTSPAKRAEIILEAVRLMRERVEEM